MQHFTENDPANAFEFPRLFEVSDHAIDPVRLLVLIFQDEYRFTRVDFIRCSESRHDYRKTTADEPALAASAPQYLRRTCGKLHGVFALKQIEKQRAIIALGSLPYRCCDHRAMKCDNARALHPIQEKRNIARTVDDLCVLSDQIRIDIRNQLPAAIPAPSAKYRMDIGARSISRNSPRRRWRVPEK